MLPSPPSQGSPLRNLSFLNKAYLQIILPRAWFITVVLLVATLVWQIPQGIKLQTNLLHLLPSFKEDILLKKSIEHFTKQVNSRLWFLVGHENPDLALENAKGLATSMRNSKHFASIEAEFQHDPLKDWLNFYFPKRYQILSPEIRDLLTHSDPVAATLSRLKQQLYSPFSNVSGELLAQDPLLFFPSFLENLPQNPGEVFPEEGWLKVRERRMTFFLINVMLKNDPFDISQQGFLKNWIENAIRQITLKNPESEVIHSGVFRFAATASEEAKKEVSTIGLGSIIGVLFLILITFRRLYPLFVVSVPICIGMLSAILICSLLYGELHLFTLVFGASLIGVSVDYAFHYLANHRLSQKNWNSWDGIWEIFPAITMGLITSVLGYIAFSMTPFLALQQIAIFSAIGLLGAYGTVVCWFPVFMKTASRNTSPLFFLVVVRTFIRFWEVLHYQRITYAILIIIGLGSLITLNTVKFDDDIRLLQHQRPDLQAEDKRIRRLIGGLDVSRFIIVRGKTVESVLHGQEEATRRLEKLAQNNLHLDYQSLAPLVPSNKTQIENQTLIRENLLQSPNVLKEGLLKIGFSQGIVEKFIQNVLDPELQVFTLNDWLKNPISKPFRHLWLGKIEKDYVSLILLGSKHDPMLIESALDGIPGVKYINQTDSISSLFRKYREEMIKIAGISYLIILLFLLGKYRLKKTLKIIGAPFLATLLTFALFSLSGLSLNLLHIVSSFLILGIGVDYTIFFMEGRQASVTGLAVLLSALTTLMSFGLLYLSNNPALEAVGLTVSLGIAFSLLLSPLALYEESVKENKD